MSSPNARTMSQPDTVAPWSRRKETMLVCFELVAAASADARCDVGRNWDENCSFHCFSTAWH